MKLKELFNDIDVLTPRSFDQDIDIATISCDSREQMAQGVFVALKGVTSDGELFILKAIEQGARVIVKASASRQLSNGVIPDDIIVVAVANPAVVLRAITRRFFGNPSAQVRTIGVTGTNGKTTFTFLMESILAKAGLSCGIIGTINHRIGNTIIPSKNTTPGLIDNQRYLRQLQQLNIPYCIMETSSHALHQGRLDTIDFVSGVFTNLTQDHLDYHKTMDAYFEAKALLFKALSPKASAVINSDDPYGKKLIPLTKARVVTYGLTSNAMISAAGIQYSVEGIAFDLVYPEGKVHLKSRFIGQHNLYNLLSAIACAWAEGINMNAIVQGIQSLTHVPGRLEPVDGAQDFHVFIDYAHTEDGLVNVIQALRNISTQRITVVFGCGGDRDKTKRPRMGAAVTDLADHAIITSDNPRSENPHAIIEDIIKGCKRDNYEVCIDRREAIGRALALARKGEIILLAGKGHETYQILNTGTIPFNERDIVMEFITKCSPSKTS